MTSWPRERTSARVDAYVWIVNFCRIIRLSVRESQSERLGEAGTILGCWRRVGGRRGVLRFLRLT